MNTLPAVWRDHRRRMLLSLLGNGVAQGALGILVAFTVGQALTQPSLPMPAVIVLFVATAVAFAGLRAHETHSAEHLGQHYVTEVRLLLIDRLLYASDASVAENSRGSLMLPFITDLNGLRLWISQGLARLGVALATLASTLAGLAVLAPVSAAWALLCLLSAGGLLLLLLRRLIADERLLRKRRGRMANVIHREIGRLPSTRARGRQAHVHERVARHSQRILHASLQRAGRRGALRAVAAATGWIILGGVVVLGRHALIEGSLSLSQTFAVVTLAGLMKMPLIQSVRALEHRQTYRVAQRRYRRLLTRLATPPVPMAPMAPMATTADPILFPHPTANHATSTTGSQSHA